LRHDRVEARFEIESLLYEERVSDSKSTAAGEAGGVIGFGRSASARGCIEQLCPGRSLRARASED